MSESWIQLPPDEAHEFLNAVRDNDYATFFHASICDVYKLPLSFYDGYDLMRMVSKYSPPFILFDYLSNGEKHYYMDGSDAALETLCARDSASLDIDNVLNYIDLYFSYVYERGNSIVYIRDPQNTGFRGSDAMNVHFQAIKQYQEAEITKDGRAKGFKIKTPLLYQEKSEQSVINVNTAGRIRVIEPLKVSFLENPKGFDSIPYRHPKEEEIIDQCKTLLSKSETGAEYLKLLDQDDIDIKVIASPNIRAITVNKPAIYIFMPAAQYTADYYQALVLAGALHDAGQILRGYKRPSIDEDEILYFDINHDKNLKAIAGICKIVEEYDNTGISDAVVAMRRLGLQDLYAAYKQDVSGPVFMDVYIQTLKDQGFIIES